MFSSRQLFKGSVESAVEHKPPRVMPQLMQYFKAIKVRQEVLVSTTSKSNAKVLQHQTWLMKRPNDDDEDMDGNEVVFCRGGRTRSRGQFTPSLY